MEKLNQNTSWWRLSLEAMHDKRLTDKDVFTYTALLDQCTDKLECTVSSSEISALTGERVTVRTFFDCIKRLEKHGYLTRTKTTGEKNTYKLADIIGLKRKPRQQSKPSHTPEKPEREQETKQRYGKYQNVLLTIAEFDRLTAEYGTKANSYIERCDSYCQSTGRHYADYNATIRRWIDSDIEKKLPKDEIKRQEFAEIDEYLQLVNQFDD